MALKIVKTREFEHVGGEATTVRLFPKDTLVVEVMAEDDDTSVVEEIEIKWDGQSRAEISLSNGNATIYT